MSAPIDPTEHLLRLSRLLERSAAEQADAVGRIAEAITAALRGGGRVYFAGNGGSAADAQHLATEYVVRFRRAGKPLAALALTTDTSLLTAAANDLGFEEVFARQVEAHGRAGDVLVMHSTSGRSPNLLRAAEAARAAGVRTVALLAAGGGPLRDLVDVALVLDTDDPAHAQEAHLAIGHAVCAVVEERLRSTDDA
ncbi:MAG: SIS domain-containing protein [Gemmatimonadota bacterium]